MWISRWDASPDADGDTDAGSDSLDGCVGGPGWVLPENLYNLVENEPESLVIIDVRPLEYCETARIPGAACNPWDGTALLEPLEAEDDGGYEV